MTTEHDRYPDIEIYLKAVDAEHILQWLQERLGRCETLKQNERITQAKLTAMSTTPAPVLIVTKAQGIFTSLLIESDQTPWPTDLDCAREAHTYFSTEIRCNAGGWNEGDEPDEWLSVSDLGEQTITWRN